MVSLEEKDFESKKNEDLDFIKSLIGKNIDVQFCKEFLIGTNLYGTIVNEAYSKNEIGEMVLALDKVCNRKDYYSFHSIGVYFFWNYETKEILYIGLTDNILRRFKQHNGLIGSSSKGNKRKEISEYFKKNERLGYTLLLRSPIEELSEDELYNIYGRKLNLAVTLDQLKGLKEKELPIIESALIEEYKHHNERIPLWNKIGGLRLGRNELYIKRYGKLFKYITLEEVSEFNSKSTLRELANNEEFRENESNLHAIRMNMYKRNNEFIDAYMEFMVFLSYLAKAKEDNFIECMEFYKFEKLLKNDYLKKELIL